MAEKITLTVAKRTETGKGPNRRLRLEKKVPAVFYDSKGKNETLTVDAIPLWKTYEQVGTNQVFNLVIQDNGETKQYPSIIWRIQHHPYKNQVVHADFYGVDLDKVMRIFVPVVLEGEAKGSEDGGVLQNFRNELEVECKAGDIPEAIHLDVTDLEINDSISVDQITPPEGVTLVFDPEEPYAVAGVTPPMAEEELEADLEEGEEPAEPTLVGEEESEEAAAEEE